MDSQTRKFKVGLWGSYLEFLQDLQPNDPDLIGLFNYLVEGMKFSYDYIPCDYNHTHFWAGIVGALNRSEIDFSPAPILMTAERWDAIAFNYPYLFDDITFLTKKPRYNPEIMAIYQTLSATVWFSLLMSIILVTIIFILALKHRYALDEIILHVLAIVLNQGKIIIPKKAVEVILVLTWMISMTIFTFCFKSVLLSFLSFPPLSGVRNIPELAAAIRAGKYSAAINYGEFFARSLAESPNEDISVIGESVLKSSKFTPESLLRSYIENEASIVKRDRFSYLEDILFMTKDSLGFYMYATAVRKDFCCKDEIDMLIHRFIAAGLNRKVRAMERHQKGWAYLSYYYSSHNFDDDIPRKITITDISGALILLVAGYFLSACVLIIEMKMKSRKLHASSSI